MTATSPDRDPPRRCAEDAGCIGDNCGPSRGCTVRSQNLIWFSGPLALYFVDRAYLYVTRFGRLKVVAAEVHGHEVNDAVADGSDRDDDDDSSDDGGDGTARVLKMSIQRPDGFDFMPGHYVQLRAAGSRLPHPFSIGSPPSSPVITLYIRVVGGFTRALHDALISSRADEPLSSRPDNSPSADEKSRGVICLTPAECEVATQRLRLECAAVVVVAAAAAVAVVAPTLLLSQDARTIRIVPRRRVLDMRGGAISAARYAISAARSDRRREISAIPAARCAISTARCAICAARDALRHGDGHRAAPLAVRRLHWVLVATPSERSARARSYQARPDSLFTF